MTGESSKLSLAIIFCRDLINQTPNRQQQHEKEELTLQRIFIFHNSGSKLPFSSNKITTSTIVIHTPRWWKLFKGNVLQDDTAKFDCSLRRWRTRGLTGQWCYVGYVRCWWPATTQLLSVMKRLSTNKHLHHQHHPNVDDQAEEMFQIEHICLKTNLVRHVESIISSPDFINDTICINCIMVLTFCQKY